MKEERIKNLIRTWREKIHNEGDQFASFVFIWFCFNAWLEFISSKRTYNDRKMLEELKTKAVNMDSLVTAYNSAYSTDEFFKLSLQRLINESKEESIRDVREQRHPISINDGSDFANIVEAIYRIRCKLFHGGKDANDTRDQVLVQARWSNGSTAMDWKTY